MVVCSSTKALLPLGFCAMLVGCPTQVERVLLVGLTNRGSSSFCEQLLYRSSFAYPWDQNRDLLVTDGVSRTWGRGAPRAGETVSLQLDCVRGTQTVQNTAQFLLDNRLMGRISVTLIDAAPGTQIISDLQNAP